MKEINEVCDAIRETAYAIHVYVKSTRIEHGLLINFGSYKFAIKKYALTSS